MPSVASFNPINKLILKKEFKKSKSFPIRFLFSACSWVFPAPSHVESEPKKEPDEGKKNADETKNSAVHDANIGLPPMQTSQTHLYNRRAIKASS